MSAQMSVQMILFDFCIQFAMSVQVSVQMSVQIEKRPYWCTYQYGHLKEDYDAIEQCFERLSVLL